MDTNRSLLQRAQEGPQSDAWFTLIDLYEPLIAGWIVRAGVQPTEVGDISQEVFETMARELVGFEHNGRTGAFRNWLKITTINRCRRYWDQRKREITVDSSEESRSASGFLDQFADPNSELSLLWDQEHDRYVIQRILTLVKNEFKPEDFEIFRRNALENESPSTLAKEFEIPVGQIYKIKFRVLQRLKAEANDLVNLSDLTSTD